MSLSIYVKSIVVLGLVCSILSSHLPVINWADNNPFYYLIPSLYSEYQTTPQQHNPTHAIEKGTQFTVGQRSIIDKIAIYNLYAQISAMKNEITTLKSDLQNLTARYDADHSSSDSGNIPESCSDLQAAGHKNSGIYMIKGTSAIQSTYCNFKNPGLDKLIGSVDVKSVPTYFYVQKTNSFSDIDIPMPFEVEVVNVGNAMDITSGKFTAPRKGTYFFSFTAFGGFETGTTTLTFKAGLYLNNVLVGVGRDEELNTDPNGFTQHNQLTLQLTLNLEANDQVWIQFLEMTSGVTLHEHDHSTHFTGFLLEENIIASL